MSKPRSSKPSNRNASDAGGMWLTLGFAFVACVIFMLPTMIVFTVGMITTFAAAIYDRTRERYLTYCVFMFNIAGIIPFIIKLWKSSHDVDHALALVGDPLTLAVMWMASGLGWVMYLSIPAAIATFVAMNAERKINAMKEKQREMMENWGADIATDRPPEEVQGQ